MKSTLTSKKLFILFKHISPRSGTNYIEKNIIMVDSSSEAYVKKRKEYHNNKLKSTSDRKWDDATVKQPKSIKNQNYYHEKLQKKEQEKETEDQRRPSKLSSLRLSRAHERIENNKKILKETLDKSSERDSYLQQQKPSIEQAYDSLEYFGRNMDMANTSDIKSSRKESGNSNEPYFTIPNNRKNDNYQFDRYCYYYDNQKMEDTDIDETCLKNAFRVSQSPRNNKDRMDGKFSEEIEIVYLSENEEPNKHKSSFVK